PSVRRLPAGEHYVLKRWPAGPVDGAVPSPAGPVHRLLGGPQPDRLPRLGHRSKHQLRAAVLAAAISVFQTLRPSWVIHPGPRRMVLLSPVRSHSGGLPSGRAGGYVEFELFLGRLLGRSRAPD